MRERVVATASERATSSANRVIGGQLAVAAIRRQGGRGSAGAGASRVDPPARALRALGAATSRHADAPRMAAHAVATASASSTAGGRLAVASTEGVRDATELGERATAGTYGRCALGASARAGGQKRRRAHLKALARAPAQHLFPAGAETLPGFGHARPDGAPARAPTLLTRSTLCCKSEYCKYQRRYQLGCRSHPYAPSGISHCQGHEDQPTASTVPRLPTSTGQIAHPHDGCKTPSKKSRCFKRLS